MGRLAKLNRGRPTRIVGWAALVPVLIVSLTLGASIHNHGLFGGDASAEKVSQSKYTCPACVFDSNPITAPSTPVVNLDSGMVALDTRPETCFERILGEASPARAPPVI